MRAPAPEMARRRVGVSAVVAAARENADRPVGNLAQKSGQGIRRRTPCVFHQKELVNPVDLRRHLINTAHFLRQGDSHIVPSVYKNRLPFDTTACVNFIALRRASPPPS